MKWSENDLRTYVLLSEHHLTLLQYENATDKIELDIEIDVFNNHIYYNVIKNDTVYIVTDNDIEKAFDVYFKEKRLIEKE